MSLHWLKKIIIKKRGGGGGGKKKKKKRRLFQFKRAVCIQSFHVRAYFKPPHKTNWKISNKWQIVLYIILNDTDQMNDYSPLQPPFFSLSLSSKSFILCPPMLALFFFGCLLSPVDNLHTVHFFMFACVDNRHGLVLLTHCELVPVLHALAWIILQIHAQ